MLGSLSARWRQSNAGNPASQKLRRATLRSVVCRISDTDVQRRTAGSRPDSGEDHLRRWHSHSGFVIASFSNVSANRSAAFTIASSRVPGRYDSACRDATHNVCSWWANMRRTTAFISAMSCRLQLSSGPPVLSCSCDRTNARNAKQTRRSRAPRPTARSLKANRERRADRTSSRHPRKAE